MRSCVDRRRAIWTRWGRHVSGSTALALALVGADDAALAALAARLAPLLVGHLPEAAPAVDGWMTSREAASYLGLTKYALYRLTSAHRVPFQQSSAGAKCWFKRELDQWRARGG